VKLATELSRRATGRTLYVLDEPTTGLHFADVEKLLQVLHRLVDTGNTVLVIEHNLDVIKTADWLIELGPAGGFRGGRIVAEGTPEQVARVEGSATGEYLDRVLRGEPLIPLSGLTFADDAGRTPGTRRSVGDGLGTREAIALPIEPPRKRAVSSRS
jgi:excinuclease ABC subunit A